MGALRPQTPDQGRAAPGPALADIIWREKKAVSRCCIEKAAKLATVVLLARRLKSRQPGCNASGESRGIIPWGKASFSPGDFPGFLGPEAIKLSYLRRDRRKWSGCSIQVSSPVGVQRSKTFGQGFGGGEPPTSLSPKIPVCNSCVNEKAELHLLSFCCIIGR